MTLGEGEPHGDGAAPADGQRDGVIVVRVWQESEDSPMLARIVASTGLVPGAEESTAATGIDGVLAFVRAWLETFGANPPL